MDSIKFTFQESLNIQKCDPFLLNNGLPWIAKADALLEEQWLNPIHSTPIQSNSIQFTYDALVAKVSAQGCLPPLSPLLHCVFSRSGHYGVKGHAESAQAIRLMHQVLTFGSMRRMANLLRHLPSHNTKPLWKVLDVAPLPATVFLNGNLRVINI